MTEEIVLIEHDKATWGEGPWQTEEDRIEWRHKKMPCLMVRNQMGAWCGYAGVTKEHPSFEKHYDKVDVSVHGGLTYADKCHGAVCHVPLEGEDGNVWWLGFDCGHFRDMMPGFEGEMNKHLPNRQSKSKSQDMYRDADYVRAEVNRLADQLLEMAT